ncbi:unnamed protein product [Pleuronectes platessa]|uniref:Uncharacterized protein n=1 Tax=Pleuronectes platessa TaxID=8262 RepID=A0A9N7YF89_PLEPL|nr:unnamed protein product [Pleuronectes platessa]
MSAVQLLRVSVHERISAAAEDFLLQVEKGGGHAQVPALRAMLTERLTAAVEEILEGLEETVAEYEDRVEQSEREICRQRRLLDAVMQPVVRLHRAGCPADVQQLMVNKEEVPPEQQQWSPLLDQEDPEPPYIKKEQEESWTNRDGQQLQGLEEADNEFTLTPVAVKSEEDEEKLQSLKLHPSETKENRADCGEPEPARNSGPDERLQPGPEDKTEEIYGSLRDSKCAERRNMSAVQLLRVSVHERISAAAEDFLLQVEKGGGHAQVPALRAMLIERLMAAAEEILAGLEETVAEYEDRVEQSEREICRQRRLLNAVMQPVVRLHRTVSRLTGYLGSLSGR